MGSADLAKVRLVQSIASLLTDILVRISSRSHQQITCFGRVSFGGAGVEFAERFDDPGRDWVALFVARTVEGVSRELRRALWARVCIQGIEKGGGSLVRLFASRSTLGERRGPHTHTRPRSRKP